MNAAKSLALVAVVCAFSAAAIACGDDDVSGDPGASSSSGNTDGGSSGASGSSGTSSGETGPSNEFVQFVKDQIVNETKNNTAPATLNDKTFTDSERSDLFDPAFFANSYEQ